MGPGATYAIVTFCAGTLLLLAWLYATVENERSWVMFKTSLLIFVLPALLIPRELLQFPMSMWVVVTLEEALKALASTREEKPWDKFWLVVLFGVWELTLSKPFWALMVAQSGGSWDRLDLAGLLYATSLPVLMHAVTAAIYAFAFKCRIWPAVLASWLIHISFNEAVGYFGISPTAVIIETTLLAIILMSVIGRYRMLCESDHG